MNFKEIYKSANNEIQGNRKLIDAVFEKAEKKHTYKTVYPAACAAALAVIAAVVLYPADIGNDLPKTNVALTQSQKSDNAATEDKQLNIPEDRVKTDDISGAVNFEKQSGGSIKKNADNSSSAYKKTDINKDEKKSENVTKDLSSDLAPDADKDDYNESAAISESAGIMVASLDIGANNSTADDLPKMRAVGGAYKMPEDAVTKSTENLSADEYYNYLGVNVKEKLKIPDGMVFDDFSGAEIEYDVQTGEIISDTAVFSLSDSKNRDRYISIFVTKIKGSDDASYLSGSANKNTAVDNGAILCDFVQSGDIYYSVTACNVTEEEMKNLLSSLSE